MAEETNEKTPLIETSDLGSTSSLNYGTSKRVSFIGESKNSDKAISETNLNIPVSNKSSTISLGSEDDRRRGKISLVDLEFANFDRITLTWSDIRVTAASESTNFRIFNRKRRLKPLGRKEILKNVTGVAYPGRLMALMGAR